MLVRAEGDERVRSATIAAGRPGLGARRAPSAPSRSTPSAPPTASCPSVDLARALGCELDGDAVAHDHDMRTTVPGVFVAGEATGIGGADLAQVEGELAGWMAAAHAARVGPRHAGRGPQPASTGPPTCALASRRRRRAKLAGFAAVLGDLFDPRPGPARRSPTPDTILCRCEDVTAGAVDAAVAAARRRCPR